jgi:ankyrin repeat protein
VSAGRAEPADPESFTNTLDESSSPATRTPGSEKEIVMSRKSATRKLPERPSLEQLRNQARDLLNAYRAGDANATEEIAHLERHPDPAAFALSDAQRVLARAYGFESWPKLKAFVDGVNVRALADAARAGDTDRVRAMLRARPELVHMDLAENDEHRALHFAVLHRDPPMTRLLMEAGADARKGIWPHRDATSAWTIARDRGYQEVAAVIEEQEQLRRADLSCPNATISPAQDRISDAIRHGRRDEAITMLDADPTLLRACDRDGRTPLHIAAGVCDEEMVAWLLDRQADPRKQDVHGLTPLDRAALAVDLYAVRRRAHPRDLFTLRFPAIARLLIGRGATITIRAAVALGDVERTRQLLAANPEALREISGSGGLLTLAVNHAQLPMVRLLLDLGADVNERILLEDVEQPVESWGMPLWNAALSNQLEIAELLLDRGADPNANVYASGWPLHHAWHHPDGAVKRLLLAHGARVHPYMLAEQHAVEEARKLLESDGSEKLVSELAWSGGDHGCAPIVEMAIKRLDWPHSDRRWHWVMIQPIRGIDGNNREGYFDCMAALLNHGIDANITRMGAAPLHFAAANHGDATDSERARFASMLIDHGARLDLRDDLLKSTPLGWACRWGRTELAKLLIARGASIEEPDAEPWATPLAWARKMGHRELEAIFTSQPRR